MSKLSKKELLDWFYEVFEEYTKNYIMKPLTRDAQAYQQIKEMIEKPKVTEEWIEEKAKEWGYWSERQRKIIKDFIRSLVEEITK